MQSDPPIDRAAEELADALGRHKLPEWAADEVRSLGRRLAVVKYALTAERAAGKRRAELANAIREDRDALAAMVERIVPPDVRARDGTTRGAEEWISSRIAGAENIRVEAERMREALRSAKDALQWCSGSADFGVGGLARRGWLAGPALALERIDAALAPAVAQPAPAILTETRGPTRGPWRWKLWNEDGEMIDSGAAPTKDACVAIVCNPEHTGYGGKFWREGAEPDAAEKRIAALERERDQYRRSFDAQTSALAARDEEIGFWKRSVKELERDLREAHELLAGWLAGDSIAWLQGPLDHRLRKLIDGTVEHLDAAQARARARKEEA